MQTDSVLKVLQQLIRIPSVNPSLAPAEGQGESAIAAMVRDWMGAHGIRGWLEEAAPGRPNAIGELGDGDGPTLVFCGHLDTVSTEGMTIEPHEAFLQDGRVYGRGSSDMKGGVAAILCAAAELAAGRFPGKVLLALVADEEYASIGAQHFVAHHKADACILTEPSAGRLILAHKGFVWAELVTTGRAAHGSRWDLGVSAIAKMGRIITALETFDRIELRARTHPLVGPASLHCSVVGGGTGLSTYADRCSLQVERRTLPGESTAQVADELRRVVEQTGEQAEIRCLLDRPPLTCDRDAVVAQALRSAAQAITGAPPEESGVSYWMDAALFANAGIPAIDYGPHGVGDHEPVEWVDLESVVSCSRVLAESARQFVSIGRSKPFDKTR
jgi:acetylornithine deacetylase